jgi:hypothetical protein
VDQHLLCCPAAGIDDIQEAGQHLQLLVHLPVLLLQAGLVLFQVRQAVQQGRDRQLLRVWRRPCGPASRLMVRHLHHLLLRRLLGALLVALGCCCCSILVLRLGRARRGCIHAVLTLAGQGRGPAR